MPVIDNVFYAENKIEPVVDPPFILIHGAASSHLGWPAELRRFPNRCVLTIDLPGHGRVKGAGCDSISGYAEAVTRLMDALAIKKAVLVGHSMGGAISQTIALEQPERVDRLILIGTGAYLPVNNFILDTVLRDKQAVVEKINQWSWARNTTETMRAIDLKALMEVPAQLIYNDYLACSKFDLRECLSEIQVPALVIAGSLDKMTPVAYSQFLVDHLPNAILKIVEGGGHWMMLEQPAIVGEFVSEWVNQI